MADWTGAAVAFAVMAMAGFTTFIVLLYPIPEKNEQLIGQIQGALWLAVGAIINYYFGSSKSSHQKDEVIDTLAQTTQTAQGMPPPEPQKTVTLEPGEHITVEGAEKHDIS